MRTFNLIICLALILVSGCEKPVKEYIDPSPVAKAELVYKKTPRIKPISLPGNVKQSSQQIAFCRNLYRNNIERKGEFEHWIAVVSSVSIHANGEMGIELLTPCVRAISSPGWKVNKDEPIYSQLKQFEKGSFVLISGHYDLMHGTGLNENTVPTMTVQISYLAKAWLG